jgi:Phospholipase_D-nuclease N-terminal
MLADTVFILAAIALASLVVWWEVLCLTDLAQADRVRFLPRWAWAVLCLIQIPLGGVLYLLVGREWRRPAATSGSAGS